MTSRLWNSYLSTVLDVSLPDGSVRRLEQEAPLPDSGEPWWPFAEPHAWVLTACNPRSVSLSLEENGRRHAALGRDIADLGLTAFPNVGRDPANPQWSEQGFTVPGTTEEQIRDLALRWEQNAVFSWSPRRWELVGVLLPGRSARQWRWGQPSLPRHHEPA